MNKKIIKQKNKAKKYVLNFVYQVADEVFDIDIDNEEIKKYEDVNNIFDKWYDSLVQKTSLLFTKYDDDVAEEIFDTIKEMMSDSKNILNIVQMITNGNSKLLTQLTFDIVEYNYIKEMYKKAEYYKKKLDKKGSKAND